jgi:hypothetical protein
MNKTYFNMFFLNKFLNSKIASSLTWRDYEKTEEQTNIKNKYNKQSTTVELLRYEHSTLWTSYHMDNMRYGHPMLWINSNDYKQHILK